MRLALLLSFGLMLAGPVLAQGGWHHYENARFGFGIDVPPGFAGNGESQNGDGQAFVSADGRQSLVAYGGHLMDPDIEIAAGRSAEFHDGEGWNITYQRTTPSWASYSGSRNGQILYVRMIALCEGEQYAAFELEYPERDMSGMDRIVKRLVASLEETGRSLSC